MNFNNWYKIVLCYLLLLGYSSALIDVPCGKDLKNVSRFPVLPGGGWDNLRNVEMLQVFQPNFSACIESIDGRYILPFHIQLLPQRHSKMEIFAEVIEHYQTYRSLTAQEVNIGSKGLIKKRFNIGGSFSYEHQLVKTTQINKRSITTRTQLRHFLYTALLGPRMSLSPGFRDRVLTIGYYIRQNQSRNADYLADMLVADYGTHYITRVDAGGIITKIDFIKNYGRMLTNEERTKISASASFSFLHLFGISVNWSNNVDQKTVSDYEKNITDSRVESVGGIPLRPKMSVDLWSDSVFTNLVPINRAGFPLCHVISRSKLGDISDSLAGKISVSVEKAIERYYKVNAIRGCMKPDAANFNPLANLPSNDCKALRFKYPFGGVYQTCAGNGDLCNGNTVTNIITGGFSCPANYDPVLLHERTFVCRQYCHSWFIFFKHCEDHCARYSIYWCSARYRELDTKTGFLFGGLFTHRSVNPVTGDKNCPVSYISFGLGAGEISLCLSRDFQVGRENAFDFGGFYSCYSGNPYTVLQNKSHNAVSSGFGNLKAILSSKGSQAWPHECPKGYAQHLAVVDGGCEVMYCTKAMKFKIVSPASAQRQPFIRLPQGIAPPSLLQTHNIKVSDGNRHHDAKKSSRNYEEISRLRAEVGILGSFVGIFIVMVVGIALYTCYQRRNQNLQRMGYEQLPADVASGSHQVSVSPVPT